jgi:hypothetical protein
METCLICYEEAPLQKLDCGHEFCRECLLETFKVLIEDQSLWHLIKCPDATCSIKPSEPEVKQIVGQETWDKYERFKLNTMVAQSGG